MCIRDRLRPDGWLRTGDLGYMDQDGYLHIAGRRKEMIIRCGENISPLEIETCIKELAFVQDVKVIGVPAEVVQEKIAACIVPKAGMPVAYTHLTQRKLDCNTE